MKNLTSIISCFAVILLGVHAVNIEEKKLIFELENVSSLDTYIKEFTEFDIAWKLVVEKHGGDLNIFLEPQEDAGRYVFSVAFSFVQSGRTLNTEIFRVENEVFNGDRMGGVVMSWDNFIAPKSPFVIEDQTTIQVEITLL